MTSTPVLQLLLFLLVLHIRLGANERDEESGIDPVHGNLVVDFGREILPKVTHYFLLEK